MHALVLVDIQNDFLPGGALPVAHADQIIPVVNSLIPRFSHVVATQDWHPSNHGSFASNHPGRKPFEAAQLDGLPQTLWPDHCIQNTGGACFAPGLDTRTIQRIFPKGTDPMIDSYSGFFDNGHRASTGLADWLHASRVSDLWICGLATDYCVKFTAIDGVNCGFRVHLIADACRGVGLAPNDITNALSDMRASGVQIANSSQAHPG